MRLRRRGDLPLNRPVDRIQIRFIAFFWESNFFVVRLAKIVAQIISKKRRAFMLFGGREANSAGAKFLRAWS